MTIWPSVVKGSSDRTSCEWRRGDHGGAVKWFDAEIGRARHEDRRLTHVSEDHGLYNGADAPNEAYLARVRYLLVR